MRAGSAESRDLAYLHDILGSAKLMRGYVEGVTFTAFTADREKQDAVALRLSILGEAAGRISVATQRKIPTVPFKTIKGLRNRIVHDYGAIDFQIVWRVIQNDLPPLINALEHYLLAEDGSSSGR